ncbi:MAG: hypothetical protein ABI741_15465 [Ferruginibacter sp.]
MTIIYFASAHGSLTPVNENILLGYDPGHAIINIHVNRYRS